MLITYLCAIALDKVNQNILSYFLGEILSLPGQLFLYCFCKLSLQHRKSRSLRWVLHILLTSTWIFLQNLWPSGSDAGYGLPPLERWTLFSDARKLPEWFHGTQILCMQLGTEFWLKFRFMVIYRTCWGVVTHLSSINCVDTYSRVWILLSVPIMACWTSE